MRFESVVFLLWQPVSTLCDSKLYWAAWAVSQYITNLSKKNLSISNTASRILQSIFLFFFAKFGSVTFTTLIRHIPMQKCHLKLNEQRTKGTRVNPPYSSYSQGNSAQVIFRNGPHLRIMLPSTLNECFVEDAVLPRISETESIVKRLNYNYH